MAAEPGFHAWNPGLTSGLPRHVRPLATVFRTENVETRFAESEELSDFCGLPASRLSLFKADRLVVHELLVRVMADLSIPLGTVYADLGVNFRRMVATILSEGIHPHLPEIRETMRTIRDEAEVMLAREIALLLDGPAQDPAPAQPRRGWLDRLTFGLCAATPTTPRHAADRDGPPRPSGTDEPPTSLGRAVQEALRTIAASLTARHGFLPRDPALLCRLGMILVSNGYGSRRIGAMIEPWFEAIVAREGYRRVRAQDRPVVMNVKGASASGKSTIRPYQRALAERTGADWQDFAVITPDVWRKFLLDYDSLGADRRYAGPLTGYEVEIVDEKLDLYMAQKATEGRISHLLIDRFRFDSFAVDAASDRPGQLLTRFGHTIYLQFMVTPPEETVERAWKRGEEFGRYKAVEDLLAHNVEAFAGIPRLFFLWALCRDKVVAFEFLDNTVPNGEVPRTIAFGGNDAMTVLDPAALLDIERFRKINVYAQTREQVYAGSDPSPKRNVGFLRACLARLGQVRFAERETGRVYARFERGTLVALDRKGLERACADATTRATCEAIGLFAEGVDVGMPPDSTPVTAELTLGAGGFHSLPSH